MSAEVLSLSEAAVESRMTPVTPYIALTRGELSGRKLAKHWVVDRASFKRYLAGLGWGGELAYSASTVLLLP